jgi:hypothetical protein
MAGREQTFYNDDLEPFLKFPLVVFRGYDDAIVAKKFDTQALDYVRIRHRQKFVIDFELVKPSATGYVVGIHRITYQEIVVVMVGEPHYTCVAVYPGVLMVRSSPGSPR